MKSWSHHLRCIECRYWRKSKGQDFKGPRVFIVNLQAEYHDIDDDDDSDVDVDLDRGLWAWQNMMQLYFMQQ